MSRIIFWFVAFAGLCYLSYRFAAWHVLVQVALIVAMVCWIGIGLALLGRGVRDRGHQFKNFERANIDVQMKAIRSAVVERYGDGYAVGAEQANPQIWKEVALGLRAQP